MRRGQESGRDRRGGGELGVVLVISSRNDCDGVIATPRRCSAPHILDLADEPIPPLLSYL